MSWLPVTVSVQPADEPVTLAEAKVQCRVAADQTDEDARLTSYALAARYLVEAHTGTKLMPQTVVMRCSSWCDLAKLPTGPITAISSISYLDTDGVSQTLSTDIYEAVLADLRGEIRLKIDQSWPSIRQVSDAITVTASAGYDVLPEPIIGAIMLLIEQWYDERSSISSVRQTATPDGGVPALPFTVNSILAKYRLY